MLKVIGLLLFITTNLWASEPDRILVIQNGKVQTIEFKNLKRVELETINHHPKFVGLGKIKYSGFLIRDILKNVNPESTITILGNTGQFSVELKAKELLDGNSIIATTPISENGHQIIYDEVALAKYPHLKQRSYWCWWVRSFITDNKTKIVLNGEKKELHSSLPWPKPYGITLSESTNQKSGVLLPTFKKIQVELLNGNSKEIEYDEKSKFFLTKDNNLHQLIEDNGKVQTFLSNLYYVKSIKVVQ